MRTIEQALGWIYYGGKHYESIYTRWYQAYVLPKKFSIDKRRAHYSNLILSGQLDRQQAFDLLEEPVYPPTLLEQDRQYVIKKLELSEPDFAAIMNAPQLTFDSYPNTRKWWELAKKVRGLIGRAKANRR